MKYIFLFEEFQNSEQPLAYLSDKPIKLKIAETEEDMRRGYMFTDGPDEDEGMLFIYPSEQILSFWMKNVNVPLDILFFDSNKNLVDYQKMEPYSNDEDTHYVSKCPAMYALELKSGWVDKYLDKSNSKIII
jgi:uncharacterized membrane protein (UPF0127 family)